MESFNDFCLLLLCEMLFTFSDLTPDPEIRYWIGWFFIAIIGFLVCVNVLVVAVNGIKSVIVAILKYLKKQKYIRALRVWEKKKIKEYLERVEK